MPGFMEEYYEPFVGGGSVFFALASSGRLRRAHLSDSNCMLVRTYRAVRDDPQSVTELLWWHAQRSSQGHYNQVRNWLNEGRLSQAGAAAAFIYLNKTCFNGLWRVNKDGAFNAAWGHHKSSYVPDEAGIMAASEALALAEISCRPFWAVPVAKEGFYYLDPPYDGAYCGYASHGFGRADHERLAGFTEELAAAEAAWLLSNADTPFIRQLYRNRRIEVVESLRAVSRCSASRGWSAELLIGPR